MKVIVLFVMIAAVFVAGDAAYALGGGGPNGDGRRADMQNISNSVGNSNNSDRHNGQTGIGNGRPTASAPEPSTLLLLSLGVIGVAGMRRKLKK